MYVHVCAGEGEVAGCCPDWAAMVLVCLLLGLVNCGVVELGVWGLVFAIGYLWHHLSTHSQPTEKKTTFKKYFSKVGQPAPIDPGSKTLSCNVEKEKACVPGGNCDGNIRRVIKFEIKYESQNTIHVHFRTRKAWYFAHVSRGLILRPPWLFLARSTSM